LNKREGVNFQFGRFRGGGMICPTEDDVVYYTTGFDIVVLYDVQEGNPGFGGLGEEEQEGFYLVKGFAVAR
jgi:hypothetical protein